MAYGQPLYVHPKWDKAKVILSLDFDFLGLDAPTPFFTRAFAMGRRVNSEEDLDKMNRLYTVESQFSLTGRVVMAVCWLMIRCGLAVPGQRRWR